jgi:hypothetical protein
VFLVDEDAVGFGADGFEKRMGIFDFDFAMAALDELRNEVHGAGAIEGDERCDVFDAGDLEFAAEVAHAAGFQLEHADGVGFVEEVVGFGVVEGEVVDGDFGFFAGADEFDGVANDGEGFEAQEIHF